MPKLTRQDWQMLRDNYQVAFLRMDPRLFNLLLDKVYGSESTSKNNPGELDDTDALMIFLARGEPDIQPAEEDIKTSPEPDIQPDTPDYQ
jgi:hypothetical protein